MPKANYCCNPLHKKHHKCISKNIAKAKVTWNARFANFVGKFICKSCQTQMNRMPEDNFSLPNTSTSDDIPSVAAVEKSNESESEIESENDYEYNVKRDPDYENSEIYNEKLKNFNKCLVEHGQPPIKKLRTENCRFEDKSAKNCTLNENLIKDLKKAITNEKSRKGKIHLLTTVPLQWSVRQMARELNVSRRMASKAKKLHADDGYGSSAQLKKGRPLQKSVIEKIKQFYLSEDISRTLPGKADYKSVSENGKREQKQKRLLLYNLNELHIRFSEQFPDMKISLSTFVKHRPHECILAGQSGTHNVCVCKTHENMRLKFAAIKQELQKKGVKFEMKLRDTFEDMLCSTNDPECFLLNCKNCPGPVVVSNKLRILLKSNGVSNLQFRQWTSTDR